MEQDGGTLPLCAPPARARDAPPAGLLRRVRRTATTLCRVSPVGLLGPGRPLRGAVSGGVGGQVRFSCAQWAVPPSRAAASPSVPPEAARFGPERAALHPPEGRRRRHREPPATRSGRSVLRAGLLATGAGLLLSAWALWGSPPGGGRRPGSRSGHFRPLVPVIRAAQAAGHTVAVAGGGGRTAEITAAGFTAFATSEPRKPAADAVGVPATPVDIPDPAADLRQLAEGFARRGGRRHAAAVLELAREWKPDVLVRDEVDFGSAIAAEVLGIPCASVIVLAAGGFLTKEVVAEPLHELRSEYGLPADPGLAMLDRDVVLAPFPPGFRDPGFPLPAHTFAFRPGPAVPSAPAPGDPTVYFTLGTVYTSTELSARVLAGLQGLAANVVATVGERVDPAVFGPLPPNVRVERFVPQDQLLPRCSLVVSHGGSGSLLGTLAHGLPSVLLPLGADQPYNARRCVELGTARVLDPVTVTPDEVREAVSAVLAEQGYRRAAGRIQDETNALPGPEQTVPLLEALR